ETRPDLIAEAEQKPDARLRVVLAEGVTSWQVTEGVKAAEFLSGEVAEIPAEGSLAPDTYAVNHGDDRAALLAEMARRQEAILEAEWENRQFGLPYDSPQEALIMA